MRRSVAVWTILLGLAALLWGAPVGLREFAATSRLTQVYYSVLTLGGIVLAGAGLLILSRLDRLRPRLIACAAAAVLSINQAVGLWCGSILCFSSG